jgi:putative membrane-bound dehydrogenase-like protein
MSRLPALSALLVLAGPLTAQTPLPKVPDGFQVEVVLQAPDIEAPTALCVAPNGDVYFAEDPMDTSGPPTRNLDRIWLLKGGDPKKKILFADQLWAVMGLEIVGDKLYCVHAPHVTVFTLDAEGKAKKREELFDDLGPPVAGLPGFNDHIPSGIRMGMDGWLYVSIGDKGIPKMKRKEKDQGSVHVAEGRWRHSQEGDHISLEGGGVIRFRPDGSGLEVFASGTRNHLDVPMDEHDRVFVRDNTDDGDGWNTRFMYLPRGGFLGYPWAFKKHPSETLPMIHDFGGGSPCGGWVYLDDGLPETYRGRIFHCEWGKGKVFAVKVAPDGAGFKFVDEITFMDPTGTAVKDFRPFTIRPTADGRGFYVSDWGFSGWLQKVKAGRIYKVTYVRDDVKPKPRGTDKDAIEDLIKALDHPAHSERLRAQRELARRGREAGDALLKRLDDDKVGPVGRRHALWVLREAAPKEWAARAMRLALDGKEPPAVRLQAVRVLGGAGRASADLDLALASAMQGDADPQVRLHAAVALAELAEPRSLPTPFWTLMGEEKDPQVRHAVVRFARERQGMADLKARLTPDALQKTTPGELDLLLLLLTERFDVNAVVILERLLEHKRPEVRVRTVEALARNYKDRKPYPGTWWGTRPEQQKPPARVVEWEGTSKVRDAIVAALADKDAGVRKAAVAALGEMNDPATLPPLLDRFDKEKDEPTRVDLARAVAGLKAPEAGEFLTKVLLDGALSEALRSEALSGLEKAGTEKAAAALARAAVLPEPVGLRVRALEALAVAVRSKPARAACLAALERPEPAVRRAAAAALVKQAEEGDAAKLLPLLADKETAVRLAAVQALGALKARDAVPALIRAAQDEAMQFDALKALAQIPDRRALSAYLTGLTSKNPELRQASAQAVAAIRDEAAPLLEELAKRKELPATVLPELRTIYLSYAPISGWRLIGPFPDLGKEHPPEKELKFDATYKIGDKEVKWRPDQKAYLKNHGKVDLAALFGANSETAAYGYAEVESDSARDAGLLIGSDDTITVWLNGKKVHEFNGSRAWKHDQEKVAVKLEKGMNKLLIKCGNHSGPWEFSVGVTADGGRYAFLQGGAKKHDLEEFRAFARKNAGDAERGRKLFGDLKGLACIKCHAVGGEGGKVGPGLAGVALKYKREDLMTSILEPSKVIAQGYETVKITTVKGATLTGVFKGETDDAVHLMDAEGKAITVLKKDIDERAVSPLSIMPNGLTDGMSLQDFADLVAYLEARREDKPMKKGP